MQVLPRCMTRSTPDSGIKQSSRPDMRLHPHRAPPPTDEHSTHSCTECRLPGELGTSLGGDCLQRFGSTMTMPRGAVCTMACAEGFTPAYLAYGSPTVPLECNQFGVLFRWRHPYVSAIPGRPADPVDASMGMPPEPPRVDISPFPQLVCLPKRMSGFCSVPLEPSALLLRSRRSPLLTPSSSLRAQPLPACCTSRARS